MDIYLNEEEELLQRSIHDLLEKECPTSVVEEAEASPKIPSQLWDALRKAGWLSVGVDESNGGNGGSVLDWVLVLEEMGKVACPGPVVEHGAAAIALSRAGSRHARAVAAGELVATLALRDGEPAVSAGAGGLTGKKKLVPYAEAADLLVVGVGDQAAVLPRSASGVAFRSVAALAGTPSDDVTFSGAPADETVAGAELRELYLLGRDAYAVGLMGRMLSMTVEYVKDRVQFGRPIGSFQAVQHHCADLALLVYGAQNLVYHAAWLVANGRPAAAELSMAHGYSRTASAQATVHSHQCHGAMGFTMEYPLQLFSRRAKTHSMTYGTAAEHREQFAASLPELAKAVS